LGRCQNIHFKYAAQSTIKRSGYGDARLPHHKCSRCIEEERNGQEKEIRKALVYAAFLSFWSRMATLNPRGLNVFLKSSMLGTVLDVRLSILAIAV
jgi:hypothetical protein